MWILKKKKIPKVSWVVFLTFFLLIVVQLKDGLIIIGYETQCQRRKKKYYWAAVLKRIKEICLQVTVTAFHLKKENVSSFNIWWVGLEFQDEVHLPMNELTFFREIS